MLTALFLIAITFGLIQELKLPGKLKIVGYRTRKSKRSALVTVPGKSK